MKKIAVLVVFLFATMQIKAQSEKNKIKALDFAAAFGSEGFSPAFGYEQMFGLGKSGKFKIGYGIRYTGYFAKDKDLHFRTAPASLTSGKSSIVALFSEDILSQIDTLHMHNVQTNAINFNIRLEYALLKKLDIGFNIDAIGATFGGSQKADFTANVSDSQGKSNNGKTFNAKPTAFNLLLISDSDIGSLNSELYARYWVSDKIGIRAGASFQFLEYKTDQKVAFDNDRFRSKQLLPFLALTFKF